jgi:hypothetical protein
MFRLAAQKDNDEIHHVALFLHTMYQNEAEFISVVNIRWHHNGSETHMGVVFLGNGVSFSTVSFYVNKGNMHVDDCLY